MYERIDEAIAAEEQLGPGTYQVECILTAPVNLDDVSRALAGTGATATLNPRPDGLWDLSVIYTRPAIVAGISAGWLAIIPALSTLIVASVVAIGIFNINSIGTNIAKVGLVLGGVILIFAAMSKQVKIGKFEYERR
jgi:hypothetical protein